MNLAEYSACDAVDLARLVKSKAITARELAGLALRGIEGVNGDLNAIIEVFPDRADNFPSDGFSDGRLGGVPMLNKDLYGERGKLLEMGSLLTKGLVAPEDSNLLTKLKQLGLNNLGRTTTPEFGMASVTESKISGVTRNPWALDRTSGGSSGGSAAAVAAGVVPIATGGDAGGSIRSPAAHCGIVGLKPTRGRISSGPNSSEPFGGMAVDFVLTRTVRDCATVLSAAHGMMPGDAFGLPALAPAQLEDLRPPRRKLRVAYTTAAWSGEYAAPASRTAVEQALKTLEAGGHVLDEARPSFDSDAFWKAAVDLWSANIALAIDGIQTSMLRTADRTNLQSSIWAYYMHGKRVSVADLSAALSTFNLVTRQVALFFQKYDILVTPTCMSGAPLVGNLNCNPGGEVDLASWNRQMNEIDSFLGVFNASGNPAISLPLSWSQDGLPIGVQFVAPYGDEVALLSLASLFEAAMPWRERQPPIHVRNLN
jgi:amidase